MFILLEWVQLMPLGLIAKSFPIHEKTELTELNAARTFLNYQRT